MPAAVIANVEGSGATTKEDRSSVTQMLSSVDSIFDVLDRRLAATMVRTQRTLPTLLDIGTSGFGTTPSATGQLGCLLLLRRAELAALLKDKAAPGSPAGQDPSGAASGAAIDEVSTTAQGFELLETAIGRLERAVRRTMSNAMFGLGPGRADVDSEGKPIGLGASESKPIGLGASESKPIGLGASESKPIGLGASESKPIGLGGTGPLVMFGNPSPEAVIADLFSQVGSAVRLIEVATADVETTAAKALLGLNSGGTSVVAGNGTVAKGEVDRGFRIVMEASTDARRVLRRTLAHPAYGFGPVSGGLGADDRRELARAGGFNSRQLILL